MQGPGETRPRADASASRIACERDAEAAAAPRAAANIIATTRPRRSTTGPPLSPCSSLPRSGTTVRGRTLPP